MRVTLYNAQQAMTAMRELYAHAKPHLIAGKRMVLEVKEETRSSAANALLHATLSDIAKQLEWAGKPRDVECWKRLLTAAWLRARGESVELLPAIDGHGVDVVFRRTSSLSRRECSELQEYVYAWGVQQGVRFTAPEYAEADA